MRIESHRALLTSLVLTAALVVGALVVGCTSKTPPETAGATPPPAKAGAPANADAGPIEAPPADQVTGKLTVLVPCGQLGPFMEAKAIFEDKYPNVEVEQKVENINVLYKKIMDGVMGEADVFMDMGDTVIAKLNEAGKIDPATECAYAKSYIAVVVPADNPAGIKKFEDLGGPDVEAVAVATPAENSNGAYAVEALKNAGLYDQLNDAGKLIIVDQPAQLKGLVGTNKVDAAFIYGPCVHEVPKGETKPRQEIKKAAVVGNVPEDLYSGFYCTAAVLTDSTNPIAAQAWMAFLCTDECSEIWQNWYFGLPKFRESDRTDALLIHCGAGIRPPMDDLAELFESRTGTPVDVAYKGSGCLLADIEFSRRGDLYVPGEQDYMDQAAESGFIVDQRPIAYMETVIITPADSTKQIETLADLAKPGIKLGLGAVPQVAVGVASKKVLDKAGLWDKAQDNISMNVLNVVELASNVKLDALDAAIVWSATADLVKDEVNTIPIDPEYSYRTTIPMGSLTFSRQPDKAQLFMELAASAEGQDIFSSHGYIPGATN